jgi:hypothetical protein
LLRKLETFFELAQRSLLLASHSASVNTYPSQWRRNGRFDRTCGCLIEGLSGVCSQITDWY